MAAVVNDSSVMYNTYTGNGFEKDSLKAKPPALKAERQSYISASTRDTIINHSVTEAARINPTAISPVINQTARTRKDSILAVKKAARDSTLAARKAAKDSLAAIKKASGDSILTARRQAYLTDSLAKMAKKSTKDSLTAMSGQPMAASSNPASLAGTGQVGPQPVKFIPNIRKLREVSLKVSRKIVYLDIGREGTWDTVTLFVYFESPDSAFQKPASQKQVAKTRVVKDTVASGKAQIRAKAAETDCSQVATDADLEFLRSAILSANTENDKISVASTAFTMKCFSVSQLRLLAGLLVSDKAKYRLMDAARLHISDRDHFRELADMYTDKNFQRKFLLLADKRS
jgi:hypothetical protein